MFVTKIFAKYMLQSKQIQKCSKTYDLANNPVITIKQGKVVGSVQRLLNGHPYYSFKGIPYAAPPTENRRFQAPMPAKPWDGILDCLEHGAECPQMHLGTSLVLDFDENCLFVNIGTKDVKPKTKMPVMVFIHGGAYLSGSGNEDKFGPEFFFLHDVVIATFNYRLEVLGFLCLDIPDAPGNAGMKDQVLAMRWIKDNIAAFGGDPDNITLFGQNVGSASVTCHLLSPMSKGLFQRAIAQSGNVLHDWAMGFDAKERAFRLGRHLGKDTNDAKALLKFLRDVPALELVGVTAKTMTPDEKYRGLPIHFTPVVEKTFNGVEAFMSETPIDILMKGKFSKVPLLTGYTSSEGLLIVADQLSKIDVTNKKPAYFVPKGMAGKLSKEKLDEFGTRIKKFYVGSKDFSKENLSAIVDLQTDLHFAYQTHRFAAFYSDFAPLYMYKFDYDTDMNYVKYCTGLINEKGACHADDLYYLFCNEVNEDIYHDEVEVQDIVFLLTKYWVEFAKSGKPGPCPLPKIDVKWQPYTPAKKNYLLLNEKLLAELSADKERVEFWDKLHIEAGMPVAKTK